MLFGGKKSPGRTVLLLDVENGSVGSALVRLSPAEPPKLFGETRFNTPLGMSRSSGGLFKDVRAAVREAVRSASEVAARVRTHAEVAPLGTVEHAAIFMAAPWGRPNLAEGRPDFLPEMTAVVAEEVARSFGYIPISLYTDTDAAAFGARAVMAPERTGEACLVCVITGELTELMRMDSSGVAAHATIPTGSHALLRTLRTHSGLSEHEARSAAKLQFKTPHLREPFAAAGAHFAGHFKEAAQEIVQPGDVLRVIVVGADPAAEWFALALAEDSLSELFPQGGEVRALRTRHLSPHIAAHAQHPDAMLMLAALFVDSHF